MKEEVQRLVISTIQMVILFGVSVFGILAGWRVYLKERSIGAQKVIELTESIKKVERDIENLKRENGDQSDLIERLDRDYKDIIRQIMDFLKK
jgi:cell division protein FtsB